MDKKLHGIACHTAQSAPDKYTYQSFKHIVMIDLLYNGVLIPFVMIALMEKYH